MTINLKEDERIDDLMRNGFKLIQNTGIFCFGMDAVLLCAFSHINEKDRVLDMCTGNGIIPILLRARYGYGDYTGIEIQDINVDMAKRSVLLNDIEDCVKIIRGDVKEAGTLFGDTCFDVVTVNPPYMKENHKLKSPNDCKAIARHEIMCTLEDVVSQASKVLKHNGRLYMVHRPARLVEIFESMRRNHIEPKRMKMVHPHADSEANMVLIEGVKGGKAMLKTEAPIVVYDKNGEYTEELLKLYNK